MLETMKKNYTIKDFIQKDTFNQERIFLYVTAS